MTEMNAAVPPSRRLPLERAFNLRDFGGYATADGRVVRQGMLFRSGTMALLSEADAAHLRSLGIQAICDFRRGNERSAEPTVWHGAEVDYFCRDYSESSGILSEMLKRKDATAQDMRDAMIALYRAIPLDHAASYRAMFAQMLAGRLPIIINCSAGKDRTGVGAALILAALGVPSETVVEDYLLTNEHADWDWLLTQRDTRIARAWSARAEALEPLLTVDEAYLESFFAELNSNHGGIEGYLAGPLGLDSSARQLLRERLLD